jgi:hypothetical protein
LYHFSYFCLVAITGFIPLWCISLILQKMLYGRISIESKSLKVSIISLLFYAYFWFVDVSFFDSL